MTATCLCGAVSVTIDARPDFIHDCNCSLCRKAGAAWGYFPSASVRTRGKTFSVSRQDRDPPGVEIHSCETCAATTHFSLTDAFRRQHPHADQAGVNMRLFDPVELEGIEVRYPNGRDWPGEGAFTYRRPPLAISPGTPW